MRYDDAAPGSRIISSRRVEEAVETADYLKLCAEEKIAACFGRNGWGVGEEGLSFTIVSGAYASTLRDAYWRYKAGRS